MEETGVDSTAEREINHGSGERSKRPLPSISNVSKEGVISKSGSDAYYNYLLYLLQLPAPEKICCDAINMAVRANFPHLWRQGYMVGFYRPVPARQQEVSPDDRITSNQ